MAEANFASPALNDALVILGAAGIVIPVFSRLRVSPVIGFILVGVLVGPYGLGALAFDTKWLDFVTISDPDRLEPFAELGIILLLFSIGLELSFARLWALRKLVFGLGSLELLIGGGIMAAALAMIGQYWSGAIALGLALAMSSTALCLPIAGTKTPVGRAALSMLLFEDIALVPIIFLLGVLGPAAAAEDGASVVTLLWQGAAMIAVLMVGGRFLLPRLFAQAARTKLPENFLAATLLVVIASALATAAVGLSPIVGALIAGILIAETEYHGEVESITEPFKGLALGIFLLTIGMGIDLRVLGEIIGAVLIAVVLVLTFKAVLTGLLLRTMGARRSTAAETGILMASPSETTLIVLAAATSAQLIQPGTAQFWQVVCAIGLTITPLLARLGRVVARRIETPESLDRLPGAVDDDAPRTIIVGFGRVGRLVADMLRTHDQPYVAIDADADVISAARANGYAAVFADAIRGDALDRLGIDRAPALILTMDEPVLAQRMVRKFRKDHPQLPIIARARDEEHSILLYKAGASHAVPETLESSLQLSEAVLVDLGVAMGPVIASIHEKRDELREQIMREGELETKPKLRSSTLQSG